jgi:hypothetical protein
MFRVEFFHNFLATIEIAGAFLELAMTNRLTTAQSLYLR